MSIQFRLQQPADSETVVDLSHATAFALLGAVGLPTEQEWGELAVEQLGPVIERCMRLANCQGNTGFAVEPATASGDLRRGASEGNVVSLKRGCTFIDMGVSDDRLRRRATEFLALLTEGRAAGVGVVWA